MPGIYRFDAEAYHRDPCPEPSLSSTVAKVLLNQSPLHAWTISPRLNPDWTPRNSRVFDIGRAAHRAVLGIGDDYTAIPTEILASNGAASTKEAKAFIEECRSRGVTPIKEDEAEAVEEIARRVKSKLRDMGVHFDAAHSETVALANIDGIWCRAMVDNAPADPRLPLYDLKTTTDASPEACIAAVARYGYDVQAAHYLDVWHAATGERRKFRFVFVEKEPPYEVSVVQLVDDAGDDADWMAAARSKAAEARRVWGECLVANEWPGYPAKVALIGAPVWHVKRWDDRETGHPVIQQKPSREALANAAAFMAP